jgi:tetratricopeptide (TPR) repeat protein
MLLKKPSHTIITAFFALFVFLALNRYATWHYGNKVLINKHYIRPDYNIDAWGNAGNQHLSKAAQLTRIKKWDLALTQLDSIFPLDPIFGKAQLLATFIYFEMGRYNNARDLAKRLLGLRDKRLQYFSNWLHILSNIGLGNSRLAKEQLSLIKEDQTKRFSTEMEALEKDLHHPLRYLVF